MKKDLIYIDPQGMTVLYKISNGYKYVELFIPNIKLYNRDFLKNKGIPDDFGKLFNTTVDLFKEDLPVELSNFLNIAKNITSELEENTGKTKYYLSVIFRIPCKFFKPLNSKTIIHFISRISFETCLSYRFKTDVVEKHYKCIKKSEMSKLLHGLVLDNLHKTFIYNLKDMILPFIYDNYLHLPYTKYWLILKLYLFYENKKDY